MSTIYEAELSVKMDTYHSASSMW